MNIVRFCNVNILHTQEVLQAWNSADGNGAWKSTTGWISKMSEEIPKGHLFHEQVSAAILAQTRLDKCARMPRDG